MAKDTIKVTAERLYQLSRELDLRQVRGAVKGALYKEARLLKREIVKAMTKSLGAKKTRGENGLGKNVLCGVARDFTAVYAGVGSRSKGHMHRNRRGLLKPVAFWLNQGTASRATRKDKNRGRVKAAGFVEEAEARMMPGAPDRLGDAFNEAIAKKAKRAGLL